ncbi:cupin domain-containing protein [Paenisporosarcina quisquiliarum]|uniref:Cupin domain-containing protein n=1 Tax=Paenisporosarcina quisquiliarum TaxID=365346 RepID=A0A9X3LDU7_9BACL|nr:cupin domain-containing protein [Paenisporosarcina quisquiliarum]MCZ8535690.1 cupin domain-containing protein [Paenisporosarcina quisquiliarum]
MYYVPYGYQHHCPYCAMNYYGKQSVYWTYPNEIELANSNDNDGRVVFKDFGPKPFVININEATNQNNSYRTALWTGTHLQVTLMSLDVGEDIRLEMHSDVDQFIRIEQGQGIVQMGKSKDQLNFTRYVYDDSAILLPAGTWHNLTNTGNTPLKLYSIYAPPNHPFGTVHPTKADAVAAEEGESPNH